MYTIYMVYLLFCVIFSIISFVSADVKCEILNGCIEMIKYYVQNGILRDNDNLIYSIERLCDDFSINVAEIQQM
jgi:hypothetical protein